MFLLLLLEKGFSKNANMMLMFKSIPKNTSIYSSYIVVV